MNEKPHLPSFIVLKLYMPKQNRKPTTCPVASADGKNKIQTDEKLGIVCSRLGRWEASVWSI